MKSNIYNEKSRGTFLINKIAIIGLGAIGASVGEQISAKGIIHVGSIKKEDDKKLGI